MNKMVTATDLNTLKITRGFNIPMPSRCPHCGTTLRLTPVSSYYIKSDTYDNGWLCSLFFCTECERCFLANYRFSITPYQNYYTGVLVFTYPYPEHQTDFSDQIKTLSPRFVKTYRQAEKAEDIGLDEICGLGYRKALEFLVKDYAIAFNPEKEDSIKKDNLSPCISEYIDNKRIQTLAKASAWLGNDETHYVRKHEDYNLGHLKAFVSAIVSYVDSELSYLEAAALLEKPKK